VKNNRRKPSAHSLVEMLAAISISTVLLGVALELVNRTITLASISQERDREQLTLNRLVEDLRRDIHTADSCKIASRADRPFELQLETASLGQITYWHEGKIVHREVVKTDSPLQREIYRFDGDTQFKLAELAQPQGVRVTVTHRSPIKGSEPKLLAYAEIETGRLLRLTKVPQETQGGNEE
jgi:type II secretory pathway pseudopilin PulG